MERAVYNSEDGKWYEEGDSPWKIRVVAVGQKVKPLHNAIADTYTDAFAALFGHAPVIPAIERSTRRVVLA